ncbi:hypothetical protein CCGE531_32525 (plasmid) [Rhizobium sp. CCGE531]|nr:hypothetical protein CCGE531_32525 [Rhizobium sp. CCGE531]
MHRNSRNAVEDGEAVASAGGSCRPDEGTCGDGRAIGFISFSLLAGFAKRQQAGPAMEPAGSS